MTTHTTKNAITDDDIRELRRTQSPITGNCAYLCAVALNEVDFNTDLNSPEDIASSIRDARARCAEIILERRARNMGVHPARLEPHEGPGECAICGCAPGEQHHLATHDANADLTGA